MNDNLQHSNTILKCERVEKSFPLKAGEGKLDILRGVDLTVSDHEIVSIVGSSGSGKSTLLHILGGLDKPQNGDVYWNGESIYNLKSEDLANRRNMTVGFVFQFYHLLPEFTAIENVMMPALIRGDRFSKCEKRASDLLSQFGMSSRLHHRPSQLSGGEQQRVSMARALMNQPNVILADEPTGNLDEKNTDIILDLLLELKDVEHTSIVLITHEMSIANRCDSIYQLQGGKLHKSS